MKKIIKKLFGTKREGFDFMPEQQPIIITREMLDEHTDKFGRTGRGKLRFHAERQQDNK